MGSSSEPVPPFATQLASAGQQFVSASVALVAAVGNVGAQVQQLDAARSDAANSIIGIREHVAKVEQRVETIERKPEDNTKWAQLALSVLALVISLVSAGYSVKFGNANDALSKRTEALESKNSDETAQQTILTLITSMVALEPQTHSPVGQANPVSLSANIQFREEANRVEILRANHHFTQVEARMFASLMRTVLQYPDTAHATSYWSSVDEVKKSGLNDSLELALVDADFARMINSKEEFNRAVSRLNACLQDHTIKPDQKIDVLLVLSQMYAGILPIVGSNLDSARDELKSVLDVLSAARTNEPDFGKDVEGRVTSVRTLIGTAQGTLDSAQEKQRKERQEREHPAPTSAPASTKP